MPRFAAILPAAGNSTRFGGPTKKPFLELAGRPVWVHAAERFWTRADVWLTLIAVAPADRELFQSHLPTDRAVRLVDGGAERFESVANALAAVPTDIDFVAVHDAVRPLTSPALIDAVFAAAAEHGAALPAVPVADTLKRVAGDVVTETVPRAGLWQAQTPQVARRDWLVQAYARRAALGAAITDDCQLLEAFGFAVRVVPGSKLNFKLTTPDDLALATARV